MITVKFFAQVREQVNTAEVSLAVQDNETMASVLDTLRQQGDVWQQALGDNLLMACNQALVDATHPVKSGDEVAFFPPVTGG